MESEEGKVEIEWIRFWIFFIHLLFIVLPYKSSNMLGVYKLEKKSSEVF